jgi:hypothetical protein
VVAFSAANRCTLRRKTLEVAAVIARENSPEAALGKTHHYSFFGGL